LKREKRNNNGVIYMQIKRFLQASSVIFLTAIVWNAFIHLVVLREADESIQHIRRSDLSAMLGLSLILTAGISCIFVFGYSRFAKNGSLGEGKYYSDSSSH
jgi:hypothetical protein